MLQKTQPFRLPRRLNQANKYKKSQEELKKKYSKKSIDTLCEKNINTIAEEIVSENISTFL